MQAKMDDAYEGRRRLLLVEDNEDTQFLMQTLLEERCEVVVASNATEALDHAKARAFDAFLLDIHLPGGISGTELQKSLRAMPHYRDTPMAAVTAYAMPRDREGFLSAGFDAYLAKPFRPDELFALVADMLGSET